MPFVEEFYRGRNVRIFRLDAGRAVGLLREKARELLAAEPGVEEVWLFGSLARGRATPGSDADLIVVLSEATEPFLERSARFSRYFRGAGIGCEVLVYTREELATLERESRRFARTLRAERVVLARRAERASEPETAGEALQGEGAEAKARREAGEKKERETG